MSKTKIPEPQVEFFLSKTGIVREVLERNVYAYLGNAEVRRAELDGRRGYLIVARRAFTKHEHASLKRDSAQWLATRESSRDSEASSTADDEAITRDVKEARHVYHEPRTVAKRNSVANSPYGFGSQKHHRDVSPNSDSLQKPSRQYPHSKSDLTSSYREPSGIERTNTATIHSSDGVKPHVDSRKGTRYLANRYPEDRRRDGLDEIVVPGISSLRVDNYQARRPENKFERDDCPSDGARRQRYQTNSEDDHSKRYDYPDKGVIFSVNENDNHVGKVGRYTNEKPRQYPSKDDRPARKRDRRVLIDDLDSVTGTQHVIRNPQDPLSTRRQGLRQSERSRRIREIGRKEAAEEQAAFRRQKSIEHLDLVREDDEDNEPIGKVDTRGSHHPRGHYDIA